MNSVKLRSNWDKIVLRAIVCAVIAILLVAGIVFVASAQSPEPPACQLIVLPSGRTVTCCPLPPSGWYCF